jgi:hypothetical protein
VHLVGFSFLIRRQHRIKLRPSLGVNRTNLGIQPGVRLHDLVDLGFVVALYRRRKRLVLLLQLRTQSFSLRTRSLKYLLRLRLLIGRKAKSGCQPVQVAGSVTMVRRGWHSARLGSNRLCRKTSRDEKGDKESIEFHCFCFFTPHLSRRVGWHPGLVPSAGYG